MLAVFADVVKIVMLETAEFSRVKENEDNDYLRITHTIGFMTMFFLSSGADNMFFFCSASKNLQKSSAK